MATVEEVLGIINSITPGNHGTISALTLAGIRSYNPNFTSRSKTEARNSLAQRLADLQRPPAPAAVPEVDDELVEELVEELDTTQQEIDRRLAEVAELEAAQAQRREQMRGLLADLPRVANFINYDKNLMMRAREELEKQTQAEDMARRRRDEEVSRDFNAKFHMWRTYEEFKDDNTVEQQREYLEIIKKNSHPNPNYYVFAGLDRLNDYFAHEFFQWLAPLWNDEIGNIAATDHWIIRYQLADDSWKSAPLNAETYGRISQNITNNSFMFDDINDMRVHFTLSGNDEAHVINTFKRFEIEKRPDAIPDAIAGTKCPIPTPTGWVMADAVLNDNVLQERDGGFMPYYYTGNNERIREYLKRLEIGIANPYYSCFVFALLDAGIDRNICDKINLRCFNRHITASNVKHIIDEFNLNIRVKSLTINPKTGRMRYSDIIPLSGRTSPLITLYRNHWINDLYDCGITSAELGFSENFRVCSSRLLVELFKQGLMAPLTIKQLPQNINGKAERRIPDLNYNPKHCIDREHTPYESITIEDVKVDPSKSPKYGWQLLNAALGGCCAVGGVVKSFISRAVHGARMLAIPGIHKNVSLLDINSLYPAAMRQITVPHNQPEVWNEEIDLSADNVLYYVLEVAVDAISPCKFFKVLPAIGSTCYYDKNDLEELVKYAGMKYQVIKGYYWLKSAHDVKLTNYVDGLYQQRIDAKTIEEKNLYKFILNHSFGKSIARGFDTVKSRPFANDLEMQKYVKKYGHRLAQLNMKEKTAQILRTYDRSFNFCYLGVMILSTARRIVNQYFKLFDSLNIPVYLHNCDSFMIPTADIPRINGCIGAGIGKLKIEKQTADAVVVKAHQYYMNDGHFRYSGLKKEVIENMHSIKGFYISRLNRLS